MCKITAQQEAMLVTSGQIPVDHLEICSYMSSTILLKAPLMWNKIYLQSEGLPVKQYHC